MRNRITMASFSTVNSHFSWKTLCIGGFFGYLISIATSLLAAENNYQSYHVARNLNEDSEETLGSNNSEEGTGEESGDENEEIVQMTITAISLVLILLTIAFEEVKEHIEEVSRGTMDSIIESLFGEMTILGFLSMFSFVVSSLGIFERISLREFGEKEELLELFESVHYMLFFIMVFFMILVLIFVSRAKNIEAAWFSMNAACLDADYMEKLDTLMINDNASEKGGLLSSFTKTKAQRHRAELTIFQGIRKEFILERSMKEPFEPNTLNPVDGNFHFGRYLSHCLGKDLANIVHVSTTTWCFFAMLTLFFFGLTFVLPGDKVEVNVCLGMDCYWLAYVLCRCLPWS